MYKLITLSNKFVFLRCRWYRIQMMLSFWAFCHISVIFSVLFWFMLWIEVITSHLSYTKTNRVKLSRKPIKLACCINKLYIIYRLLAYRCMKCGPLQFNGSKKLTIINKFKIYLYYCHIFLHTFSFILLHSVLIFWWHEIWMFKCKCNNNWFLKEI